MPNAVRVRQVLEWLSLTGERSLSLITLYLGGVDYAGHEFGPDAPETDSAIARVDSADQFDQAMGAECGGETRAHRHGSGAGRGGGRGRREREDFDGLNRFWFANDPRPLRVVAGAPHDYL